jgi:hypothetical protein
MNAHHIEHIKLAVINDGNGDICGHSYKSRLTTARMEYGLSQCKLWTDMVFNAARKWEPEMSMADRLRCAAELAEYYAEHIKEGA